MDEATRERMRKQAAEQAAYAKGIKDGREQFPYPLPTITLEECKARIERLEVLLPEWLRSRSTIKLTELIAVWDLLHVEGTCSIGFCDLQRAMEKVGVSVLGNIQQEATREEADLGRRVIEVDDGRDQ